MNNNIISSSFSVNNNLLVISKGYGVRATTIEAVKTLLLHRFALREFHVTDSQNTRD